MSGWVGWSNGDHDTAWVALPASGSPTNPRWVANVKRSARNCFTSSVKVRHHRANRNVRDLGNLFVGEAFHVGQIQGAPKAFPQRVQRGLDLRVR